MHFAQSCLRRSEGDQQKADYLFNCSYFEYFWRLTQYNEYARWHQDEVKKATKT